MRYHPLFINKHQIPDEGMSIQEEMNEELFDLDFGPEQAATPVQLDLKASMLGLDLIIQGSATAEINRICDRCGYEFCEIVQNNDICHHIEQCPDLIDLTEQIREDILLSFPPSSLCSEACQGLCQGCGVDLNHHECKCSDEEVADNDDKDDANPFAQALDNLKFE